MKTIKIDSIDVTNRRYCISYPLSDEPLLASIRQFGILVPVLLLGYDPPVIISGFKRIDVAAALEIKEIPCTIVNTDDRQALLMAIHDNMHRPLNIIEKAHSMDRLVSYGLTQEELYPIMKMLDLPTRQKTIETLCAATGLDDNTKDFISTRSLPLSVLEQLLWFTQSERTDIVGLLRPLHVTMSHAREVLQLMMLLKVKQGSIDIPAFHGSKSMEIIKEQLKRLTHPLLISLEERLSGIRGHMGLPSCLTVQTDPYFERESIDIRIKARNTKEIAAAAAKLGDLLDKNIFRSIFDLTSGTLSDRN